jgi:hypothetical protein
MWETKGSDQLTEGKQDGYGLRMVQKRHRNMQPIKHSNM